MIINPDWSSIHNYLSVMRKIMNFLFFAALTAGILASCKKDDPIVEESGEAKLATFGFYQEDNEGIIFQDYEVAVTGNITIALPKEVDKSALVARFTTTAAEAVVQVATVEQKSGVTANDFTVPVDYIVTNGTNNAKYTVTVSNSPDYVWTMAGSSEFTVSEFAMKVNPATNIPYVVFNYSLGASELRKAGVFKFENSSWSAVGTDTITSAGVSNVALSFDNSGKPYVAFSDYGNENSRTPTVKSFNGTSWANVGAPGITDVRVQYNSLVLDRNNQLYLFAMNDVAGGALPRRALNMSTFNGSTWTANQALAVRTLPNAYRMRSIQKNGNIYLAINDYANNSGTVSVYILENGSWSVLAEGMRHEEATESNYYDLAMDVDSKGNVYAMSIEKLGEEYKLVIHKYTASSKKWSIYGSPITLGTNNRYYDLAISPFDVPYVIYRTGDDKCAFTFIDSETKTWTEPYLFSANTTSDPFIDFDSTGKGYVVIQNTDNKLVIYKYDSPK